MFHRGYFCHLPTANQLELPFADGAANQNPRKITCVYCRVTVIGQLEASLLIFHTLFSDIYLLVFWLYYVCINITKTYIGRYMYIVHTTMKCATCLQYHIMHCLPQHCFGVCIYTQVIGSYVNDVPLKISPCHTQKGTIQNVINQIN